MNLLFTSVGRRVELLRAFRQAYRDLDLKGRIIATDIDPLAPALQGADQIYIVPPVQEPDYLPVLADIARRESVDLIFPLIDPDIPVLAAHRKELEQGGARLLVVPLRSAQICHDKWLTVQFLAEIGVPAPRSWVDPSAAPDDLTFPLFIKPRTGSAGKDAVRVEDEQALQFFLERVPDPIVQECLPGPEITSDVTCDLEGKVLAVVSRQRIEVRWGEVAKGRTVHEERIREHCVRIAAGLNAIGPLTVQCMLREGDPYFIEINARFGGGLPLGIAAGVPSPRWYLAMAAGLPVDAPPLGTYQAGLYLTRYDESYFLTEEAYDAAQSRRLRPG